MREKTRKIKNGLSVSVSLFVSINKAVVRLLFFVKIIYDAKYWLNGEKSQIYLKNAH